MATLYHNRRDEHLHHARFPTFSCFNCSSLVDGRPGSKGSTRDERYVYDDLDRLKEGGWPEPTFGYRLSRGTRGRNGWDTGFAGSQSLAGRSRAPATQATRQLNSKLVGGLVGDHEMALLHRSTRSEAEEYYMYGKLTHTETWTMGERYSIDTNDTSGSSQLNVLDEEEQRSTRRQRDRRDRRER